MRHAFVSVENLLQGQSGMWHACTNGHAEVVSELLPHGGSANDADEDVSFTLSAPCLKPLPEPPASISCLNLPPQPSASSFCLKSLPHPPASSLCLTPLPWISASIPCLKALPQVPASNLCPDTLSQPLISTPLCHYAGLTCIRPLSFN